MINIQLYGKSTEYDEFFNQSSLWPSILNNIIEGGNTSDISYQSLLITQAKGKNNTASRASFLPKPSTFTVQKINVTGDIYLPSNYHLLDANNDYWSLNINKYILRISYSEPLILSDIAPFTVNIAMLFYCHNHNVLIYRALMDIFQELTKVELLRIRDIWEPFNITVDGDYLKWYLFRINMNAIWPRISYQCYNTHHLDAFPV